MFPTSPADIRPFARFLRASGGVSAAGKFAATDTLFSPRKRRCFLTCNGLLCAHMVFSAQAEVFLLIFVVITLNVSFLRASGGVSILSKRFFVGP